LEQATPDHPLWSHGLHLFFSAMLLVPPTVCMGGTFPLMCRFFARKKSGGQIGRLYAFNTLGATAGAFSAGYLLIPVIGLSQTGYLAVILNVAIAVLFWRLAATSNASTNVDVSRTTRPEQHLRVSEHRLWLIAIGLIGFFSLAYEILWTRVFLLFLGNTTYAFSLILCAFLIGLALGGAIYARQVRPDVNEKKIFSVLCALMGISVLATAPFYDRLAYLFQFAHEATGENWWALSLLSFFI
ncbi:MAG: hypothetical protein GWN87_20575, partial [Desulfuromonadales bacterium]|nr:hypothetical protein [Desulfuromonadales bacterium]NIS42399.1 hypothetical protein [Desulfuromonadales bacterium]